LFLQLSAKLKAIEEEESGVNRKQGDIVSKFQYKRSISKAVPSEHGKDQY